MRRHILSYIMVVTALIPANAAAQDITITGTTEITNASESYNFKRQGVFGCSQTGSYSMSVGSLSAVGGVYVPVNDAAVTLNTGYLVYKECVLRGVLIRQREAALAGIVKQITNSVRTGRDGNPLYVERLGQEQADVYTRAIVRVLQNETLKELPPSFSTSVKRAIAQGYKRSLTEPSSQFKCGYQGNIQAALEGREFSLDLLGHLMNPACNPYWSYDAANKYANQVASFDRQNFMTQIGWGDGFYPVQECDEFGNCVTVTPGSVVQGNFTQALTSGFRQLEQADDIDQMVNALFSGITSQVIGDNRGIAGLLQQTGTQASYIDQLVREAAQGLRDAAGNAALQILAAAKQIEAAFRQAMQTISGALLAAVQDLRAKETACWKLIVDTVCATTPAADNTCTEKVSCTTTTDPNTGQTTENCPTGNKLKIATSTAYSQQVIDARIRSLASTTESNIAKSTNAIELIDKLIAGITNTNSVEAQRVALQQLDNLTAQRALHNQYDLQEAQKARDDITASMETLRTDTVKAWSESMDVNVGWCNINNASLVSYWKQRWKQ